ncbi:MAG: squalene/phytoene synthase family protein, partial [Pseudomonadota bacterium]
RSSSGMETDLVANAVLDLHIVKIMLQPNTANASNDNTDQDWAQCWTIALARPSTLVEGARALEPIKQEIFVPCYAAMRIIDDRIDEEAGAATIKAKNDSLERWLDRTLSACRGIAQETGIEPDDAVFRALAAVLPKIELGELPWRALHQAMRRDLEQTPMINWRDFADYCEGATVAPTYIYLVLLLARAERGRLISPLPKNAIWAHAQNLGIFCYLVHIIRDHQKDARMGPQLLTVPETAYSAHFSSKADLARSWRRSLDQNGRTVLAAIDARAEGIEGEAAASAAELAALMAARERQTLRQVFTHYRSLRQQLRTNYLSH